jgi:predicted  nucleic acid-binding Zn-ribbon protein
MEWFYDDTGYYSYVLLNATEAQYVKVQQVLRSKGLQVLQVGRSFRPASNGCQYQWYIRVADEDGKHPSPERITGIFAAFETTSVSRAEFDTHLDEVKSQKEEIRRLRTVLSVVKNRYQAAKGRLEYVLQQYRKLQNSYGETQRELQEYRERVDLLESQLREIREAGLEPEDIDKIRREYEWIVQDRQRLAEKLAEKERELVSWINNFDPEIQKREQEVATLKNQIANLQKQIMELSEKNDWLANQVDKVSTAKESKRKGKSVKDLYCRIIEVLLPNVRLLRGSFDTLWHEVPDLIKAAQELFELSQGQLKGKRVETTRGANGWLERHFQGDWRLYYRRCEGKYYQVLISDKKSQKEDIDWLNSIEC